MNIDFSDILHDEANKKKFIDALISYLNTNPSNVSSLESIISVLCPSSIGFQDIDNPDICFEHDCRTCWKKALGDGCNE